MSRRETSDDDVGTGVNKDSDALEELLSKGALWRARDRALHNGRFTQNTETISSGFAELDQCLPHGGWPKNAFDSQ